MNTNNGPIGPIIDELNLLEPKFPSSKRPLDEAIYFSYAQARVAYYCLSNLLQNNSQVIGIYIYAWSIVDNAARFHSLMNRKNETLRQIRNSFQHADEKIKLYKKGSIPVFGSINWWNTKVGGQPEFGIFPDSINRTFCSAAIKDTKPSHIGVSHVTLSALGTEDSKDKTSSQRVLRLDEMVLEIGREVCNMYGSISE